MAQDLDVTAERCGVTRFAAADGEGAALQAELRTDELALDQAGAVERAEWLRDQSHRGSTGRIRRIMDGYARVGECGDPRWTLRAHTRSAEVVEEYLYVLSEEMAHLPGSIRDRFRAAARWWMHQLECHAAVDRLVAVRLDRAASAGEARAASWSALRHYPRALVQACVVERRASLRSRA